MTGPYRPQLSQFFLSEVADEQMHAQFLANKILALGGEPTTQPRPVPNVENNHRMVEEILNAEKKAIADYSERASEAEQFGDKGLMVQLEDMVGMRVPMPKRQKGYYGTGRYNKICFHYL